MQSNHTRGAPQKWTKENSLEVLKNYEERCNTLDIFPSIADYRDWRKEIDADSPSFATLQRLFGSWNNARKEAIGNVDAIFNNSALAPKWTERLCLAALQKYETHCREGNINMTRDGYQEWQKKINDAPSIGPIEQMGSWNEMRLRAASHPETLKLNHLSKRTR